ncbi:MAG: hypothetical protein RL885_07290 [Planctomycetota bacterium]
MTSRPSLATRVTLSLAIVLPMAVALAACSTDAPRRDAIDDRSPDVSPPMTAQESSYYEAASRIELPEVTPENDSGIHNLVHLSPNIVSGSEPHGEQAFVKLAKMGIKTVLSVDGKAPDVELAKKHGLRYVHVPIQYSGIDLEEMTEIAKTFRELEGPFFVHCFHGKHRGPAGAAVGRVVLDGVPREQAIAEMRQWCGTSKSYDGLYGAIAAGDIPSAEKTRALEWDFPEAHRYTGFRHAMIELTRAHDNLKHLYRNDWQVDPEHPDIDPGNEATKIAMLFQTTADLDEVKDRPEDFRTWLSESVDASNELREALTAWKQGQADQESVDTAHEKVTELCGTCHKSYRND